MSGRRSKRGRPHAKPKGEPKGLSRGWTWALLGLVGVGFVAFVSEPQWRPLFSGGPAPGSPEQLALGETLYGRNCAVCHGLQAEGQVAGQPMGGQRADGTYIAPALNGTGHMWHHPPDQLLRIVKHGSPAADSPMRGFADRMSHDEMLAVLTFLQSRWPLELLARYRSTHGGS